MFKNKPSPDIDSYVITLVGDPGVGKTTFFVEAGCLLLDFERGFRAMECDAVCFIEDSMPDLEWSKFALEKMDAEQGWTLMHPWERFRLFLDEFCTGSAKNCGFGKRKIPIPPALVLDTVDAAYDVCVDFVCKREGWRDPDDGGKFGRGWTTILKEFQDAMRILLAFANHKTVSCGVGFISHSKVRSMRSFGLEPIDKVSMALTPSAAKWLFGISDFVFYAECALDLAGTDVRVLHTQPASRFDAKARGRRDIPFPSPLPLAYHAFAAAWQAIVAGEKPDALEVLQPAPASNKQTQKSSVWS